MILIFVASWEEEGMEIPSREVCYCQQTKVDVIW